jgi:NADPH:quinone reductase-like Zn-dependent oxidoreductase
MPATGVLETMKAMGADSYGPVEGVGPVDVPLPEPSSGEIRIRIVNSAINPADFKVVLGMIKFLHAKTRPLVVGYDFSGTVDAVGSAVRDLAVGDEVFGFLPFGPFTRCGAFSEFLVAKANAVAKKPARISHETAAAAATTGMTALQSLRDLGRLPKGGRVLVTGASGGVGSMAVGIAKRLGAEVTAVSRGPGLELARALGADHVVDRSRHAAETLFTDHFDVVFDAAAAYTWGHFRGALRKGGAFVTTGPSRAYAVDKIRSLVTSTRVHLVRAMSRPSDLALLASWIEQGLEVPIRVKIPVREVVTGLLQLQTTGGRISVQVAGGF